MVTCPLISIKLIHGMLGNIYFGKVKIIDASFCIFCFTFAGVLGRKVLCYFLYILIFEEEMRKLTGCYDKHLQNFRKQTKIHCIANFN